MLTKPPKVDPTAFGPAGPGQRWSSSYLYLSLGAGLMVLLAIVLTAFTDFWPTSGLQPLGSIKSSGVVTVQLSMSGFRPKTIEAKAGIEVRLRLVNAETASHVEGGDDHQFAIDELGVSYIVEPKVEQVVTFTPITAGTYTFYCDVCCGGQENPTMRGKLIVTS